MGRVLLPCGAYINLNQAQEEAYYRIQHKIDLKTQPGSALNLINGDVHRHNAVAQQALADKWAAEQKFAQEQARQDREKRKQKALQAETQKTIVDLKAEVKKVTTTNIALTSKVEEQTQSIQKLEESESAATKEIAAIKELLKTLISKLGTLELQGTEIKEESQKIKEAVIAFQKFLTE